MQQMLTFRLIAEKAKQKKIYNCFMHFQKVVDIVDQSVRWAVLESCAVDSRLIITLGLLKDISVDENTKAAVRVDK